jgi:hypothetical protein
MFDAYYAIRVTGKISEELAMLNFRRVLFLKILVCADLVVVVRGHDDAQPWW